MFSKLFGTAKKLNTDTDEENLNSFEYIEKKLSSLPENAKFNMIGHLCVCLIALKKENEELKSKISDLEKQVFELRK